MTSAIKITRHPYEEPYILNLVIEATNGPFRGTLEFYTDPDELLELANALEVFPRESSDSYIFELGSENPEESFAFYLKLRVFTVDMLGHCGIHIRLNSNIDNRDREVSEFCISPVEPSGINQLGKLFRKFAKLEHNILYWKPNESKLFVNSCECDIHFFLNNELIVPE